MPQVNLKMKDDLYFVQLDTVLSTIQVDGDTVAWVFRQFANTAEQYKRYSSILQAFKRVLEKIIGELSFRPPDSRWKHPYFYWRPHIFIRDPIFSLQTPYIFVGDPSFSLKTQYFHFRPKLSLETPRFSLETPRFSQETRRFSLKTQYFHCRPKLSLETPRFSLEIPQIFIGDPQIFIAAPKIFI